MTFLPACKGTPHTLHFIHSCINIEAYEQAIRYYEGSKTVLEEYPNVISFNTIMKEATVIINQLKDDLVHKLRSQDISESKVQKDASSFIE